VCKPKPFDIAEIRENFKYEDGKLWLKLVGNYQRRCSNICGEWGEINTSRPTTMYGYVMVWFNGASLRAHRIIFALTYDGIFDQSLEVDHLNGVRHDNRPENLFLKDHRRNGQNKPIHRKGRLCGAYYDKIRKKWGSQARVMYKHFFLGYFESEEEAHAAYCEFVKKVDSGETVETRADRRANEGRLKGARYDKRSKKWGAQIMFNYKKIWLGTYSTEVEAHEAYIKFLSDNTKTNAQPDDIEKVPVSQTGIEITI
jgi:hypothetical protein